MRGTDRQPPQMRLCYPAADAFCGRSGGGLNKSFRRDGPQRACSLVQDQSNEGAGVALHRLMAGRVPKEDQGTTMPGRFGAEHWRMRAAEARSIAEEMADEEARWRMLRVA